jgi:DNA replication licensing factor MCM7
VKIEDFLTRFVPQPRHRGQPLPADDDEEAEDDGEDLADDLNDLDVDGEDGLPGRSKAKYMKVMRKVANRQTSEVVIDLADLRKVCPLTIIFGGYA